MKISALSVALALACALPAQQATDASSGKLDQVRSLHEKLVATRNQVQEDLKPLMAEMRKLERGSPAQQELAKKMNEIRSSGAGAQEAFEKAFAASEWQKFDPSKDAALLKDALPGLCRDLEHPAKALEACKHYLEHFGDERMAAMIRTSALPNAQLATGNAEEAAKTYEAAIAEGGSNKARTMLSLGDLRAAQGRIDEAKKLYEEAGAIADEATMNYVTLRKELIGKPAPEIASEHWVGAEASSLAAKKGKVVLVDFWATWCGPCRAVMPALNAMYKERKGDGLEVVGVTRFYDRGYMAADESQMLSGGESVQGMDEKSFLEHVTTFKKNTGIAYPFVIGPQSNFTDYHVKGIPTLAVIDRAGNVALITVGSGSEGLLKFAVDQLLAKKQ